MNNDGVSIAFELIAEELEAVADDIANKGATAFKERRYDDAQRLGETGKALHGFIEKIKNLMEEWQAGIDVNMRRKIQMKKIRDFQEPKKSQKTKLKVEFKNSKRVEEYFAADTFALAIKEIGFNEIEPLGISVRGIPLVGDKKSFEYNQRQIDGKYICVHSSTQEKKELLDKISKQLGLGLKVEIIK